MAGSYRDINNVCPEIVGEYMIEKAVVLVNGEAMERQNLRNTSRA
jgi:hypothetical protein